MQSRTKFPYYLMLLIVVITWGFDPIVNRYLYGYYSAAALSALSTFVSALAFLFLARKKLRLLDQRYFRIALPICLCNSLAGVLQRIGLQYTTPARYAFLEHLSCIAVPLVLFFFFKKRPGGLQILASVLCLIGCLVLSGAGVFHLSFGIGDILCALAGILFGVGIVTTAMRTQGMDMTLFMTVHMCTYFLTSLSLALTMNFIKIGGAPMEPLVFSPTPPAFFISVAFGLFTVGFCWLLRNEATRHINPTLVAVLAPLAAVITAVISIARGMESATPSLLIASALILSASALSGIGEQKKQSRMHKSGQNANNS